MLRILHSLIFFSFATHGFLVLKQVSLVKLKDASVYKYKVKSGVISLMLYPFNRTIVVNSLLRFIICLTASSRPDNGSSYGFHLGKWDLILTKKGRVTATTPEPTTTAQTGMYFQARHYCRLLTVQD